MIYSKADVRKLLKKKSIVLTELSGRRLSKSQVIIEVGSKNRIDVLTLPLGFENDAVLDLIFHFFTLSEYCTRVSNSRKTGLNKTVKRFLSFIENNTELYLDHNGALTTENSQLLLPFHIFKDWLNQLKKKSPSYSYNALRNMRQIIKISARSRFDKISLWPKEIKHILLILEKLIPPQPPKIKSPPLGRYFGIPNSKFSNKELFMGLRFGIIWLLLRMHGFRKEFCDNTELKKTLLDLKGCSVEEIKYFFGGLYDVQNRCNRKYDYRSKSKSVLPIAFNALRVVMNNPLLTEWQVYSLSPLRKSLANDNNSIKPLSSVEQAELLESYFDENSSKKYPKGYGKTEPKWKKLKSRLHLDSDASSRLALRAICFWGIKWLKPSGLEELSMTWLLAGERAQFSGIRRLKTNAIFFSDNKSSMQVSTLKLRRMGNDPNKKAKKTDVESNIYYRNSPTFKAYSNWLILQESAQSNIKNFNSKLNFIPTPTSLRGLIATQHSEKFPNSMLPLELLSTPGTVWYDTFINDAGDEAHREASAFIAILKNRVEHKRNNKNNHVSIPINVIGQSLVVEQELMNNIKNNLSGVEAETTGHNETTGRAYKDGFNKLKIEDIIEPIHTFARKIGDAKIKLAYKIADKLTNTNRKVTLIELEKLCGVESASIDQLQLLSNLDSADKLTIAGEILLNNEILIVETEMTAGLMYGYIKHLEAHLPNLILSNRDETAIRYLAKFIYLHQTFKRFDSKLQQAGRKIADSIAFPFPHLS